MTRPRFSKEAKTLKRPDYPSFMEVGEFRTACIEQVENFVIRRSCLSLCCVFQVGLKWARRTQHGLRAVKEMAVQAFLSS